MDSEKVMSNKIKVGDWVAWSKYVAKVIIINDEGTVRVQTAGFKDESWFYSYEIANLTPITEQEALMHILSKK